MSDRIRCIRRVSKRYLLEVSFGVRKEAGRHFGCLAGGGAQNIAPFFGAPCRLACWSTPQASSAGIQIDADVRSASAARRIGIRRLERL